MWIVVSVLTFSHHISLFTSSINSHKGGEEEGEAEQGQDGDQDRGQVKTSAGLLVPIAGGGVRGLGGAIRGLRSAIGRLGRPVWGGGGGVSWLRGAIRGRGGAIRGLGSRIRRLGGSVWWGGRGVGVGSSVPPVQLVRINGVNILSGDCGSDSCQGKLGYHCGLKYRDCHTPGTYQGHHPRALSACGGYLWAWHSWGIGEPGLWSPGCQSGRAWCLGFPGRSPRTHRTQTRAPRSRSWGRRSQSPGPFCIRRQDWVTWHRGPGSETSCRWNIGRGQTRVSSLQQCSTALRVKGQARNKSISCETRQARRWPSGKNNLF